MGVEDDHVLFLDQVLGPDVADDLVADLGPPLVAVCLLDSLELVDDDLLDELVGAEDLLQLGDQGLDLFIFLDDLVAFEVGQPLELHLQNGLGLDLATA